MIDEDLIHHVNKSSYRVKVIKTLENYPKIPKDIAADCGILQNHISNVLTELSNLGLIVCINPEVKKGRLYRLTKKDKKIIIKIK